jgi:hypothetical protein
MALLLAFTTTAQASVPVDDDDFISIAPQGFGDRQNSWAWAMQWWNGYLYVGTNRAWHCAEFASFHNLLPRIFPYPPVDPDIECTDDPEDLPLQAEIWRWSAATNTWERVYQSPNDILLPSGKYTSRDVGFRGMTVYTESDGTEALYVTAVATRFINFDGAEDMPPPRILRSTDGVNFEPVPQTPGTLMGDLPVSSLRNPFVDKGKMYVIGGLAQGSGFLLESANPAGGDDDYVVASADNMIASAGAGYNDQLYVGTQNLSGYRIYRADNSGTPPYDYTLVVDRGGYLRRPNNEILNMVEYDGLLYAGGNGIIFRGTPAELIRVNPDDTWDLVVGNPRYTPDGWKLPLSGFGSGFGNVFNGHMWRLQVHNNQLYVGTFDSSTTYKDNVALLPILQPLMGFDLWRTPDGVDFYPVSTTGFGDMFNFGVRSMDSTPYGLFVGTANYYYGVQIWQSPEQPKTYLPSVLSGANSLLNGPSYLPLRAPGDEPVAGADWLSRLETTNTGDGVVVSWEPAPGANQYQVMRSTVITLTHEAYPDLEADISVWDQAEQVGTTQQTFFTDTTAEQDAKYVYYVEADTAPGAGTTTSNFAAAPSLKPPADFQAIDDKMADLSRRGRIAATDAGLLTSALQNAELLAQAGNYPAASDTLVELQQQLDDPVQTLLSPWEADDLSHLVHRLNRQIQLIELGALPASGL